MISVALFFLLVAVVSTKTHYEKGAVSRIALLLNPSGERYEVSDRLDHTASKNPETDPAGGADHGLETMGGSPDAAPTPTAPLRDRNNCHFR